MASSSREELSRMKRLPGSCDRCWKKKVRCDRATMGGTTCSNCLSVKAECTHTRRKGTKNRSKTSIQSLKTAKELVTRLLSTSTVYIPSTDPAASHKDLLEVAHYARALEEQVTSLQSQLLRNAASSSAARSPSPLDKHTDNPPGGFNVHKDGFIPIRPTNRSFQFVKAALQHVPVQSRPMLDLPWKRPEVWTRQPWEILVSAASKPQQTFPEDDLLSALVDIFFEKVNPILSVIHQPSFRKALFVDRKHIQDLHFGAVVLAVCALGSRYSEDPRVLLEGTTDEHSCGWKWFCQVRPMHAMFWPEHPSTLYQLQLVVLSISFISSTAMGLREEIWTLAGLGLRFAEAADIHRRTGAIYNSLTELEAEQYRRAVWLLVVSDSIISSFQGRQGMAKTMPIDELDLDLPADCDEEYWGTEDATQPFGKPSKCAFTLAYVDLVRIIWDIQETVYPEEGEAATEEDIIALDSQLNRWVELIPDHLKWNANLEDLVFLDQSAALYATYYHAQIILHRVFIPLPGKETSALNRPKLPFPSLAICANAARSCAHVISVQAKRGHGLLHLPTLTTIVFDCAIVLFVNILSGGRKIRTQEDFTSATVDVQRCLSVMRLYERRWRFAGRRCDAICAGLNLIRFAILSNPSLLPGAVEAVPSTSPSSASVSSNDESSLSDAARQLKTLEESMGAVSHLFTLPLRTEELGSYNMPLDTNTTLLPDGLDCLQDPIEVPPAEQSHSDFQMDLEAMFGTGFSPEQLFGESTHQSLDPTVLQRPVDAWNMFSRYEWGDWTSHLMDETS
ncbi:hypothetical protein C8F01DRAFT_1171386 [Mycena amicta]|nr:hypothetical protein C8F01DRAFT_1171386 [Mycena amicta]